MGNIKWQRACQIDCIIDHEEINEREYIESTEQERSIRWGGNNVIPNRAQLYYKRGLLSREIFDCIE